MRTISLAALALQLVSLSMGTVEREREIEREHSVEAQRISSE